MLTTRTLGVLRGCRPSPTLGHGISSCGRQDERQSVLAAFGPPDEGQKGRAVTLVRSGVVLAALLVLTGCAEPIVLRPPHPEDRAPGRGVAVGPRLIRVDQAATPGSLIIGSLLRG